MAGFFAPGIVSAAPYIVKTYRKHPADCARQTWSASLAARALDRARCIVARPPGPWTVGRAWCALVRDLVAELRRLVAVVRVPGGVRLVRDPRRVRPGGPRPWRVRLVAWPPVPGPPPPAPAPGPKNGPGRVLRGHLPDFTQSVVPKTVF